MDEEIVQYMKRKFNLLIGERSAEIIKMTIDVLIRWRIAKA